MTDPTTLPAVELVDLAAVDRAHALANKEALLEHARMGRSVCEGRDGKVVWITPAEIFARYGLDENGRPRPEPTAEPALSPAELAQYEEMEWLDKQRFTGQLDQYRGQYLIAADRQILAYGPSPAQIRSDAENRADAENIPRERLVTYFVPGLE